MRFLSHFGYSKRQRSGIFFLLFIVVLFQVLIFFKDNLFPEREKALFNKQEEQLYLQMEAKLDSLRKARLKRDQQPQIFPFNPNFISDEKGYLLGMSVSQIDKLHAFRSQGKYVRDAASFQVVTGVSDSLLKILAPFFKFPEFTRFSTENNKDELVLQKKDLNKVTREELVEIYGIGDVLSRRIIEYRKLLKGFSSEDQLLEVYGLKEEVVNRLLGVCEIKEVPLIQKLNVNTASLEELAALPYINDAVASEIVAYRSRVVTVDSLQELTKIHLITAQDLVRFQLYLAID